MVSTKQRYESNAKEDGICIAKDKYYFKSKQQKQQLQVMKPFAATKDNPELNLLLKEKVRSGDPMAAFVVRQDDQKKRGFDGPHNRYGIKPGRHWDGVDRSNGFEKALLKKLNERKAQDKVAYLSSVSHVKNITHHN